MKYKIPFIKPSFPQAALIAEDYERILESNWFTNFGPFEREFRLRAAGFINDSVEVCTASNATLAIEIAVRALLGRPDKKTQVLVPSFTFAAGPEVLIANGFIPVFIDIDENMQPDIKQAHEYIMKNGSMVAGILLCNIFGVGNTKIEDWEVLAKKYNLPLIIDSAAGFGSRYNKNEMVGARGNCEIFSLHATKPFAVGEGGLVVSKDKSLIEKLRQIENFGFDETRTISAIGTNAKLPELSCAIGLRQLDGFNERLKNRRSNLKIYKELLEPQGFSFQPNDELSTVPFVTTIAKNSADALRIRNSLLDKGVEVRNYYHPLHNEKILMDYCLVAGSLSATNDISSRILSLPLHDHMDKSLIEFITTVIIEEIQKEM